MQQGFFFLYKNNCDKKPISTFCHCNHVPGPEVMLWLVVLRREESFKTPIFLFVGLDRQLCVKKSKWDALFHVIVKHVFFPGHSPTLWPLNHPLSLSPFSLPARTPCYEAVMAVQSVGCPTRRKQSHNSTWQKKNKMYNLHWLWQILTVLTWGNFICLINWVKDKLPIYNCM